MPVEETCGEVVRIVVDLRGVSDESLFSCRLRVVGDVLRRGLEVLAGRRVILSVLPTDDPVGAAAAAGSPAFVLAPGVSRPVERPAPQTRVLRVGVVRRPPLRAGDTVAGALGGHEPSVLRLSLLRFPPDDPAVLSAARLHRAEETIQRWRYKVALWADMPPAGPIGEIVDGARESIVGRLDTATVLQRLHRLEVEPRTRSGAKFATFASLDRALGLDLCRLVGKVRR